MTIVNQILINFAGISSLGYLAYYACSQPNKDLTPENINLVRHKAININDSTLN